MQSIGGSLRAYDRLEAVFHAIYTTTDTRTVKSLIVLSSRSVLPLIQKFDFLTKCDSKCNSANFFNDDGKTCRQILLELDIENFRQCRKSKTRAFSETSPTSDIVTLSRKQKNTQHNFVVTKNS